jgi:hypothetical protein
MLHVVADDSAGMLFAAGSISALFELGALSSLEVWSCSGLGCVVMSILLTVCEGLFDHVDVKYQLETTDPIHRMAVEHFMSLVQSAVKEMPQLHSPRTPLRRSMFRVQSLEFLVLLLSSIVLAAVSLLEVQTQNLVRYVILTVLLCLIVSVWNRTHWQGCQYQRLLARYVCNSSMSHKGAGVLLMPTSPMALETVRHSKNTRWLEENQQQEYKMLEAGNSQNTQAPLIVITNAPVMPTMDRRTTQYQRLHSLRDAVYSCTIDSVSSAMTLDQLLLGPLNAFYTYNRMPLRCKQGRTLLLVDGWSLSPSYCASSTKTSAHKRMEDDITVLVGAPDHNAESLRCYTVRPIALIDTSYTVDDTRGNNLRDFYSKIHTMCANGAIVDQCMIQDLLNWGYLATCVVAGTQLLAANDVGVNNSVESMYTNLEDNLEESKSSSTCTSNAYSQNTENTAIQTSLMQLRLNLGIVMDLRPFQSSTYFNIKQFLQLYDPLLSTEYLFNFLIAHLHAGFRSTVYILRIRRAFLMCKMYTVDRNDLEHRAISKIMKLCKYM